MTREFQAHLARLDEDVLIMAELARAMLRDGFTALRTGDAKLADKVIAQAKELGERDEAIETSALNLLMLHQPVARDLRRIAAVLKLITYLTRVGRYGYDMARATADLPATTPRMPVFALLGEMAANVEAMVDIAVGAFRVRADAPTQEVLQIEHRVDAQRWAVWRESLAAMIQDNKTIEQGAIVMMVARYLERCGDNVVKMVEKIHYAATGERIQLK